jgi:hypothetical protein
MNLSQVFACATVCLVFGAADPNICTWTTEYRHLGCGRRPDLRNTARMVELPDLRPW